MSLPPDSQTPECSGTQTHVLPGQTLLSVEAESSKHGVAINHLLAALPTATRRRLLACGEPVTIRTATVLHAAGALATHVYFPVDGFVGLLAGGAGSSRLEVGLVGNEGMLGVELILGTQTNSVQWLVLGEGRAWRIDINAFLGEVTTSPRLRARLNRYLQVVIAQLMQTVACKRFHLVEARLARWLLMSRDRAHSNDLHVTHETLALLMGVRRAGITRAASSLQARKLISYSRGDVRIVDGRGLKHASCSCYEADTRIYADLMS